MPSLQDRRGIGDERSLALLKLATTRPFRPAGAGPFRDARVGGARHPYGARDGIGAQFGGADTARVTRFAPRGEIAPSAFRQRPPRSLPTGEDGAYIEELDEMAR